MKKAVLLYFGIGVFILQGCSALDLYPISSKNVENFYRTPDEIEQALVGCYTGLRAAEVQDNFSYMMTESRSDNAWQQVDYDDGAFSRFSEKAETPTLNNAWSRLYSTIYRCNMVINALSSIDFENKELKNQYLGEAKFIRALMYFDLVRYFGGVPLVKKPITINEAYKMGRNSIREVYDFIVEDLESAVELLPDVPPASKPNRATKAAAYGFLGKVYVYECGYPLKIDNWSKAKSALNAALVIVGNSGWMSNYADIFDYNNENKSQSIFSLGFKCSASSQGNPFPSRNAPNNVKVGEGELEVPYGGSPYRLFLDNYIVSSIFPEEGDLRRDCSIQDTWLDKSDTEISEPFVKKYRNGPVGGASDWDVDWIMLRYTDVYMLYAEALYHTGLQDDALVIINKVRERAGLTALTANAISDEEQFTDVILRERRAEFCFENQRWFDLVRTDRAFDTIKAFLGHYGFASNIESKDRYYYPIPYRETEIYGIK